MKCLERATPDCIKYILELQSIAGRHAIIQHKRFNQLMSKMARKRGER